MSALDKQTGGNHYKHFIIQPIEYTMKNGLGFIEGNIIKYVSRHKLKNGAEDIQKVKHYAELLLEIEYGIKPNSNELETAVNAVATNEENSAVTLTEMVINHPVRKLILKRIVNEMINQNAIQELEDAINEAATNHSEVEMVECLDILMRT